MKRTALISQILLLMFALTPIPVLPLEIPELRKLNLDPTELRTLTEDRFLVLLHPAVPFTPEGEKEERRIQFVTVITQIRAPLTRVSEVVTDFVHYPEFMPQVKKTRVSTPQGKYIVEYGLRFELPVINLNLHYTIEHRWVGAENLEFLRISGDIAHIYGRWEFLPSGTDATLLAYTVWSDTESMGFLVRTMLDAQPDLRIAIPISSAVVVVHAVKDRVEGSKRSPSPQGTLSRTPRIPLLTRGDLPRKVLSQFSGEGSLLFVHPAQRISLAGKPLDLLFVTGVKLSPLPLTETIEKALSFSRYPEFIDQVRKAIVKSIPNGWDVEWRLKLGFGILSVPVDYTLRYEWIHPQILRYYRIAGDLEYVFGAWEFLPAEEQGTLIFYTTASELGDKAPVILKLGNLIPNRQMVVGTSAASVILEKLVGWLKGKNESQ